MVNRGLLDDDCLECLLEYVCAFVWLLMCGLSVVLRGGSKSF